MSQDQDVMHRYLCARCGNTQFEFGEKIPENCSRCRTPSVLRKADYAATVSTTQTLTGPQYDSIESLTDDVDRYREEDQTSRSWKEIDESRRQ